MKVNEPGNKVNEYEECGDQREDCGGVNMVKESG